MKDYSIIGLIERASTLVTVLGLCSLYIYIKWKTTEDTKTKLEITMENLVNVRLKESEETAATKQYFQEQLEDKAKKLTYACNNMDVWGTDTYNDKNTSFHSSRRVCMDVGVMPYHQSCVVYSIEMYQKELAKTMFDIAAELYGCEIRTFVQQPLSNKSLIIESISPTNQSTGMLLSLQHSTYMNLQDVALAMYQEDTIVDIVHIDIEREQWNLLNEMLQIRATRRIKQLLVTFRSFGTPHSHYLTLQALEDAGMQLFAQTENNCDENSAPCENSAYINSHYLM